MVAVTQTNGAESPWDVIVVGAGPAGCAAAAAVLAADPDARLLLLDRSRFPRDKPCGDGVASEIGDVLATLGFDTEAVFAGMPPVCRLRIHSPAGVRVDRELPDSVHVAPREVFDARLVADVRRRGVELRQHTVREVDIRAGEVVLDGALRTRIVVAADGAESRVRRAAGWPTPRPAQVAVAIRGYAPELPDQAGTQIIRLTGQHWPAYAWSFPLGDGRSNVGYGQLIGATVPTRTHLIERMTQLLPGVDPHPDRLRAHRLPLSSGRPAIREGRILLAGDAQSLINPLTGEGIFYAVTSGALAGRSAVASLHTGVDAGLDYRRSTGRHLRQHFRHTTALARLGRWHGIFDAGMRAAASDQQAFDDLVRLGLADGLVTGRVVARLRFRG